MALTLPGALALGVYDGFIGPGTGTFAMFLFALAGFSLVRAGGNARTINFATNLGAFISFLLGGQMVWWLGVPMGLANALGAALGARMAMQRGAAFVKWIYALIVLLVAARLLFGR